MNYSLSRIGWHRRQIESKKDSHIMFKLFILSLACICAFTLGKLFVRSMDIGNITRCQNYRAAVYKNPAVFFTLDYGTIDMCSHYSVDLIFKFK